MNLWDAPSEYAAGEGSSAVRSRMSALVRGLGLEHFSFMFLKGPDQCRGSLEGSLFTSYPDEWVQRYVQYRYWQIDPVSDVSHRSIRPFFWGQGSFLRAFAKQQQQVFEEADAFDIKYGLTIPVRGVDGELSIFNVVSSNKSHLEEVTHVAKGRIFAAAIDTHEIVLEKVKRKSGNAKPAANLSKRELECLSWTLEGKTAGEIAAILGISVSTVNQHASSASNKLGSLNKHHAAVQALRMNLIQ